MSIEYIIEKHTHGWLICAAPEQRGVPMSALGECQPLFECGAVFDAGVAHHFNALYPGRHFCFAVTTQKGALAWRAEIAEKIKTYAPAQKWWFGTDVGTSSAAMFAALGNARLCWTVREAAKYGARSTPRDSDDLGRCLRLLKVMPELRGRLSEVAEAYPDTAWPQIIAAWDELETADPKRQNEILAECHIIAERSKPKWAGLRLSS